MTIEPVTIKKVGDFLAGLLSKSEAGFPSRNKCDLDYNNISYSTLFTLMLFRVVLLYAQGEEETILEAVCLQKCNILLANIQYYCIGGSCNLYDYY